LKRKQDMKRILATVTRGGQVTLPAEIRTLLGVKAGEKVAFAVDDGVVRVERLEYQTVKDVSGKVPPLHPPLDWKEVEQIVKEERAERYREKMRRGDA
jgi:AbrB family looped-hinge helix DNA binding protein